MTLFALSALPLVAEDVQTRSYQASAFDLESNELLYVEKHVEVWRAGRLSEREVVYEDPSQGLIAEKHVRYGTAPTAPSFEMLDLRLGTREGAEVGATEVTLFTGPIGDRNRSRKMARPTEAVVDAGFDAFLRQRFADLLSGQPVEFDFAVPALRRFVRFELVPSEDTDGVGKATAADVVRLKLRPSNPILQFALDPIELDYSPDGLLLEFRGLANVSDAKGKRYKARIVFDYSAPEVMAPSDPPNVSAAGV